MDRQREGIAWPIERHAHALFQAIARARGLFTAARSSGRASFVDEEDFCSFFYGPFVEGRY